jgi:leader peptidase (prepilin peptidase) / N-methyltransferase
VPVLLVVVSASLTAVLAACGPATLRRIPEPTGDSTPPSKVPYAALASTAGLRPGLAAAGALVGALVGWRLGQTPILAAWVYLGAVGLLLAYVDWRTRLLPTRIIAPSYAAVCVLVTVATVIDADLHSLVRAALGWLTMGGCYFLLWLAYPRGLGYGDVRLSGLLGIALGYLGWAPLLTGLYSGFLLGGIGGGVLAMLGAQRRRQFAFGPFMLLGCLVGITFGSTIGAWYTSR